MQYVAVKFRQHDRRSYTYHNDGPPVAIGDSVKVPDKSGDGWSAAIVAALPDGKPPFPTKSILGKVEAVKSADLIDMLDDPRIAGAVNDQGGGRTA